MTMTVDDYSDVMTSPAECLSTTETVSRLRHIVEDSHSHNGYPVVEDYYPSTVSVLSFCKTGVRSTMSIYEHGCFNGSRGFHGVEKSTGKSANIP